jgi:DNA polymerase III delta prime subunit
MKRTFDKIVLFLLSIAVFDMVSIATAQKQKDIDELDRLISKSKNNMSKAGNVVQQASKAQEKVLGEVVSHIEEVEKVAEEATQKIEIFSVRMIEAGVDTSTVVMEEGKVEYVNEIKDAYKKYVDDGGDYDIENFILYIYNKKIN